MNIHARTKLSDLLREYPELEEKIIGMSEPFKNLRNPVLRRTVAKLATLEKIAGVGNLQVSEFVNNLRREVGLPPLPPEGEVPESAWHREDPDWIKAKPYATIDGTEMLDRGEHPLAKVNSILRTMPDNEIVLLKTNFRPVPLIAEMEKQDHRTYTRQPDPSSDSYETFIQKEKSER